MTTWTHPAVAVFGDEAAVASLCGSYTWTDEKLMRASFDIAADNGACLISGNPCQGGAYRTSANQPEKHLEARSQLGAFLLERSPGLVVETFMTAIERGAKPYKGEPTLVVKLTTAGEYDLLKAAIPQLLAIEVFTTHAAATGSVDWPDLDHNLPIEPLSPHWAVDDSQNVHEYRRYWRRMVADHVIALAAAKNVVPF